MQKLSLQAEKLYIYIYIYISLLILAIAVFAILFRLDSGMMISSFVIDFMMAAIFIVDIKKLSSHLRTVIGITKFLGDAAAWIFYKNNSVVVNVLGVAVLVLNLFYIAYSMELSSRKK